MVHNLVNRIKHSKYFLETLKQVCLFGGLFICSLISCGMLRGVSFSKVSIFVSTLLFLTVVGEFVCKEFFLEYFSKKWIFSSILVFDFLRFVVAFIFFEGLRQISYGNGYIFFKLVLKICCLIGLVTSLSMGFKSGFKVYAFFKYGKLDIDIKFDEKKKTPTTEVKKNNFNKVDDKNIIEVEVRDKK